MRDFLENAGAVRYRAGSERERDVSATAHHGFTVSSGYGADLRGHLATTSRGVADGG